MKINKLSILFTGVVALGIVSCENEDNLAYISPSPDGFTLIAPEDGSSVFLDKDTPNNPALTVSWNEAVYDGTATQVIYSVEVDKEGDDFDTPYSLGGGSARSLTVSVEQLNLAAQTVGLSPNNAGTLSVRVKAVVNNTGDMAQYSNSINYTVTPYLTYLFRDLFLVGSATAPGWNNNNTNPALWRDPANSNLYEYTGKFTANQFKLLEKLGQWQPQWGVVGAALAGNPGTQSGDPDTFNVSADGYYKLTVNMTPSALSYTFEPYPAGTAAPTYNAIGMIGTAVGGWTSDDEVNMTQSSFDPHIWYVSGIELATGELKFRANNDWAISWGDDTQYSGRGANNNDPNIPVTGTVYNVWFNDLTAQYMLIPVVE